MKRSFVLYQQFERGLSTIKMSLFFHYHSSMSPHNKKFFYRKTYPYFFHINTSILQIFFLPLLAQPITTSLHFNSNIHYTLLQGRKDIKIFLFPIFPFFILYIFLSTHGCITIICHQSLDQNQFCLTFFFYIYIEGGKY